MNYAVRINKRFQYMKVVKINKRIHDNTNAFSRAFSRLVDKYIVKKKSTL